jgi:hypothetical protein
MATGGTGTWERIPRRGRYLIPKTTPRRAELIAAASLAALVAHLVFAQLTIAVAAAGFAIAKVTRWRPQWLAIPAAAGVIWALAMGPARAASGFTAGPRQVVAYLGGVGGEPARVLHLGAAFGGAATWLPRQLPLALVCGAAEAALLLWFSWLHTDEWQLPEPRPGAVVAVRRWYVARAVRGGGVVTRDGACLGIDGTTGGRAALSWREAAGGVLCTGAAGTGTTTTSLQLVHAAIRRRKPVIAVDLAGDRQLAEWFTIVCAAAGAPLQTFGAAGPGYYEPLRGGDSGRRTALVTGMIDWVGTADQYRRSCGAYLNDLFAVTAAAPGDPRTSVLDEVLHLLNPAALRARAELVPSFHPHRQALIDRVKVSASLFESDPQTAAALSAQLTELRSAPIGRWLAPPPAELPGGAVDLGQVLRRRGVAAFSLGPACGRAARTIASLVAQDVTACFGELRKLGVAGDGLIWFDQCGAVPPGVLAELTARCAEAGVPTVLTTTSGPAAQRLADHVNTVVIHRIGDPVMAERFAWITGEKLVPAEFPPPRDRMAPGRTPGGRRPGATSAPPRAAVGAAPSAGGEDITFARGPLVPPERLCGLRDGEFTMIVKSPSRLVALGRTIPPKLRALPRLRAAAAAPPQPAAGAPAHVVPPPRQPFGTYRQQPGSTGNHAPTAGAAAAPSHQAAPSQPAAPRFSGAAPGEFKENRPWPT